jgi:hypothetical protein
MGSTAARRRRSSAPNPPNPLPPRSLLFICPWSDPPFVVEAVRVGRRRAYTPLHVEDRPLSRFVAVSGNSIVANARFAPACRNNSVVAGGLRDLRP